MAIKLSTSSDNQTCLSGHVGLNRICMYNGGYENSSCLDAPPPPHEMELGLAYSNKIDAKTGLKAPGFLI